MPTDAALRQHLLQWLTARQAHLLFEDAVEGLPPAVRGRRPEGLPHSPWELVEHIRRTQRDILDFCRASDYIKPVWPGDYLPPTAEPPSDQAWEEAVRQVAEDREAMCALVRDPAIDLYAAVPCGQNGETYLREVLLFADHTAYHVGQLIIVRHLLGAWH
jgi:hypothetical protein